MNPVKVTAVFDDTEDHDRLRDDLMRLGAYDIDIEDVEPEPAREFEPKQKKPKP